MERPIKGGYILVSLGLIALSTSYSGSIDYDRISKTKKHIVLTGIKVGDTVMPDICVKPVYGNGTITFEDVYGYDVVVSSNNSVSVSEHTVSGTQLFIHDLTMSDTNHIIIIDNSSELIDMTSLLIRLGNSVKTTYKGCLVTNNGTYYDEMEETYRELPEIIIASQTVNEY